MYVSKALPAYDKLSSREVKTFLKILPFSRALRVFLEAQKDTDFAL